MQDYQTSTNSQKRHFWRAIDLGQQSLRWKDVVYHQRPSDHQATIKGELTKTSELLEQMITLDRLALCELESLTTSSKSNQSVLGRPIKFPQWKQIDTLTSSPYLGSMYHTAQRNGYLWVNTDEGEFKPTTLLSRWLSETLTPPKTIGEEPKHKEQSLIWLTSTGRLPSVAALTYRCLSELPYAQGASINKAIAILIGLGASMHKAPKGLWGVLDIGMSQGSWTLIESGESHVQDHLTLKVLRAYGRSWIGERGLRRALLNHYLNQSHTSWSELSQTQRVDWIDYVSLQADHALKKSWPRHLISPHHNSLNQDTEMDDKALDIFQRYQHGTYLGILAWIKHSLETCNVGTEALKGIYITGKHGISLVPSLKRALSAVNIRVIPENTAFEGAQHYVQRTLYDQNYGYHVEECSPYALIIRDDTEGLTKVVFEEQSSLPLVKEVEIGPSKGPLSLWLSSYGDIEQKVAFHPPLKERTKLQIYYEGPHLFELIWTEKTEHTEAWQRSET